MLHLLFSSLKKISKGSLETNITESSSKFLYNCSNISDQITERESGIQDQCQSERGESLVQHCTPDQLHIPTLILYSAVKINFNSALWISLFQLTDPQIDIPKGVNWWKLVTFTPFTYQPHCCLMAQKLSEC